MNPPSFKRRGRERHQRSAERYTTEDLRCLLGDVADLSERGMRVRGEGKPLLRKGDCEWFAVWLNDIQVWVRGRVVWIKKSKHEHELGIEFANLAPELGEAFGQYGRDGKVADPDTVRAAGARTRSRGHKSTGDTPRAYVGVDDLYAHLGVDRSSSTEEITMAYRRLAKRHHPDVSQDPASVERFILISKSYKVLSDPDVRARYDQMLDVGDAAA